MIVKNMAHPNGVAEETRHVVTARYMFTNERDAQQFQRWLDNEPTFGAIATEVWAEEV